MRRRWVSAFFSLALLFNITAPATAAEPVMLQFSKVDPSPGQREAIDAFAVKLNDGDATFFNDTVDFAAFEHRVKERFAKDNPELRSPEFSRPFFLKVKGSLGNNLFSNLTDGSKWNFIRLREFGNREFALFRVDQEEGSLVFLDFEIDESGPNGMRIVDWYDYGMGRWGSEGIAAGAEFAVKAVKMSLQGSGYSREVIDGFLRACRMRDYSVILSRYRQLPEPLRRHPFAMHAKRLAGMMAGDESYRETLNEISEEGYSIERSLSLVDHYYLKGEYENARRAIADFSRLIGGDAALDGLLASVYQEEGKYLESVLACEKAIMKDPDYEKAYLILLTTFGACGSYGDAILVLDLLASRFGYEFAPDRFEDIEELRGFIQSRELAEWLSRKKG